MDSTTYFTDEKGVEHRLDFNEAEHTYFLDGKEVDSVSDIIDIGHDFRFVDPGRLAAAADFGHKVHKTIELYEKGTLNRSTLAPELENHLKQWIKAKEHLRFDPIAFEVKLASTKYHCAGTMDTHGLLLPAMPTDDVEEMILDVKSGAEFAVHKLQTAGYKMMAVERGIVGPNCKRACLYLTEDSFAIKFHSIAYDMLAFISLSTYAYWKRHHGNQRN